MSVLFADGERSSNDRAFNHSGADQADRNAAANNFAFFHNANLLQVQFEFSAGDPCCFAAVTAQVLCFTALRKAVPERRLVFAVSLELLGQFQTFIFLQRAHGNNSLVVHRQYVTPGKRCQTSLEETYFPGARLFSGAQGVQSSIEADQGPDFLTVKGAEQNIDFFPEDQRGRSESVRNVAVSAVLGEVTVKIVNGYVAWWKSQVNRNFRSLNGGIPFLNRGVIPASLASR